MLTAQQALDHLLSHAKPVAEIERVPMQATLGRVLAENVNSLVDVPPLDNTAMDGYAVRTADTQNPGSVLKIAQRIPAGSVGTELQAGTAARIFTGAPVPLGADAVVMQEDCATPEGSADQVQVNIAPVVGQWIRRRGEDLTAGKTALTAGTFLRPQELWRRCLCWLDASKRETQSQSSCIFYWGRAIASGRAIKAGRYL